MKESIKSLKIAIVHDFLTTIGGGERVVLALHELFPQAPIYTLRYDEEGTQALFKDCDIRIARLANTFIGQSPTLSMPFLPNATETLPLSEYDIVISSSSAFAKGVITKPDTLHICYCHTPMRYAWDWTHEYARENGYDRGPKSIMARLLIHYLRIWDQASAERVDSWIANSKNVARRIDKYYRAKATVIYPPVTTNHKDQIFDRPTDEPYFLIVSRLSPYKRIDLAIEASARFDHPLVIIGKGSDEGRLKKLALDLKAPVAFLGFQDDDTIAQYYTHCRAFLFTGEDDFGITPVEAMSYGKPVIAYGKGGVLETVIDGKTGIFFNESTTGSLVEAIERFMMKEKDFKQDKIKERAKQFSKEIFDKKILEHIESEWKNFSST